MAGTVGLDCPISVIDFHFFGALSRLTRFPTPTTTAHTTGSFVRGFGPVALSGVAFASSFFLCGLEGGGRGKEDRGSHASFRAGTFVDAGSVRFQTMQPLFLWGNHTKSRCLRPRVVRLTARSSQLAWLCGCLRGINGCLRRVVSFLFFGVVFLFRVGRMRAECVSLAGVRLGEGGGDFIRSSRLCATNTPSS